MNRLLRFNTLFSLFSSILLVNIIGCTSSNDGKEKPKLQVIASPFGAIQEETVTLYTLQNKNKMSVKVSNFGGTVTSIVVPDKKGNLADVAAGFDSIEGYFSPEYIENAPYFGGIVGRYASVIKDASFELNGQRYDLEKNLGSHHLHGGVKGFDRYIWDAEILEFDDYVGVRLTRLSKDGEASYPGNVLVTVEYRLNNANELSIFYNALSDKDTPFSLTNHTYFNLNGFEDNILDHEVKLNSQAYLLPDDSGTVDGTLADVKGTAADFSEFKPIRETFETLPNGFEHFYVFENEEKNLLSVAEVKDKSSGRSLQVFTTEPGALFYTGRYTSDQLTREDGTQYGQFRAFCIETSKYPNGPNIEGSPRSILKAGEVYEELTVFRFGW